jgi:plastocyanin
MSSQKDTRGGFFERSFGSEHGIEPSGWLILLLIVLVVGLGIVIFRFPETSPTVVLKTFFDDKDSNSPEPSNAANLISETSASSERIFDDGHYVHVVRFDGTLFSPDILVINSGDAVRFINGSTMTMRVGSRPESLSSTYYSSISQPAAEGKGATYEYIFTQPGIWSYENIPSTGAPIYGIVFIR